MLSSVPAVQWQPLEPTRSPQRVNSEALERIPRWETRATLKVVWLCSVEKMRPRDGGPGWVPRKADPVECVEGMLVERCHGTIPWGGEGKEAGLGRGRKWGPTTALSAPQGTRETGWPPSLSCGTEVTQPFDCPPLGVATTERVWPWTNQRCAAEGNPEGAASWGHWKTAPQQLGKQVTASATGTPTAEGRAGTGQRKRLEARFYSNIPCWGLSCSSSEPVFMKHQGTLNPYLWSTSVCSPGPQSTA